MPRTCTREQARELDRRAMEEYGIPGIVLMENAGHGAAAAAMLMLGDPAGKRVAVFCGKGNNGGDGYVVGRHLHNLGAQVSIILSCKLQEVEPESDAGVNLHIIRRMRIPLCITEIKAGQMDALAMARGADLIVDALLGTGLSGEVKDPVLSLIRIINAEDKPVVSIDIPSGLDANTGNVLRAAVRADRTVTFVLPKQGFYKGEGPSHVGEIVVIDIGIPRELIDKIVQE